MKLWAPLEIFKKRMNLTKSSVDSEVLKYALQAQNIVERLTHRKLDATINRSELRNGGFDYFQLTAFPIRSGDTTEIFIDTGRDFAASSEQALTDFIFENEKGLIFRRSGTFPDVDLSIKCNYRGGYYPLITAVDANDLDSITVADELDSYSDIFQVYVVTKDSESAGTVTITGTDENGDALEEILTPDPVAAAAGDFTVSLTQNLFASVTAVATDITGDEGTISVFASSIPRDLVLCAELIASHFYLQDQKGLQEIGQQTYSSASESDILRDIPEEAKSIIQKRKLYQ